MRNRSQLRPAMQLSVELGRKLNCFGPETLEPRACPSAFYTLQTIVQESGSNFLGSSPSINDVGTVAYTRFTSTESQIWVAEQGASARQITSASGNISYRAPVQINNTGQIVNTQQVVSSTNINVWESQGANAGSFHQVAHAFTGGTQPLYRVFSTPSLANDGTVAFVGTLGLSGPVGVFRGNAGQTPPNFPPNTWTQVGLGLPTPQPTLVAMAADNGWIVDRHGANATDAIQLYRPGVSTTIIANSTNFSTLGASPSISDDGRMVVFFGELTASGAAALTVQNGEAVPWPLRPGRGIFASIEVGASPVNRIVVRIAGETGNGELDPGERMSAPPTAQDLGPDLNYDATADWGLRWDASIWDNRPGVGNLVDFMQSPLAGGNGGSSSHVVYTALDPVHGSVKGMYSSRINLYRDSAGNYTKVGVETPLQVLVSGESVAGLGVVTDLGLHDPVNRDGVIVAWAAAGATQGIIKAIPNSRMLLDRVSGGLPQNFIDLINNRTRFDPDSALVDQVVVGVTGNSTRAEYNQIIMHATVGFEPSDLRTLASTATPSIHYLVSRQGRVTQILPESAVANHAGVLGSTPTVNTRSIGIELVDDTGHRSDPNWATPTQLSKAARLVRDISLRRGIALVHPPVLPSTLHPSTNGNRPIGVSFNNQGDPNYLQSNLTPARDGYNADFRGVLAHGQVLNRSSGKDDPRIFNWPAFVASYNTNIVFRLNSPANLLITDPLGRRIGVDPATGNVINEIPGATFSGIGIHPQIIELPPSQTGSYSVQVNGTGDGPFSVDVLAAAQDAGTFQTQVRGIAAPGSSSPYTLLYNSVQGGATRLTGTDNLPPIAFDDSASMTEDHAVTLDVTSNDTDPDGGVDRTSVTIVTPPMTGVVSVDAITGEITYTPPSGFTGTVAFSYLVNDVSGVTSDAATVTIGVVPRPIPVAFDDMKTTSVGTVIAIDVLANDDSTVGLLTHTVDVVAEPSNGVAVVDPVTGTITYTPNSSFIGTDLFRYTVAIDEGGISNEATVTVEVVTSGDFNDDGFLNLSDIDQLIAQIAGGTNDPVFDLTGDGLVNLEDRDAWLTQAGAANLPSGNPYLHGDANFDGFVDGTDFGIWNANKFTNAAAWSRGDFSADGVVDGSDFGIWNANKFTSSDRTHPSLGTTGRSHPNNQHVLDWLMADVAKRRKRLPSLCWSIDIWK